MTENPQVQWILKNYDGDGTFPSLRFAKFSKAENIKTCEKIFKDAVDDIASLSIKQYQNHSKWIKWSRQVKKQQYEVLSTITVKQYFYQQMRKNILLEKMLFDARQEMSVIKNANNIEEITGDSNNEQDETLNSEIPTDTEEDNSRHNHDQLDNNEKWFLSTGKCVDDELFIFGKQCNFDHSSKSMIIDIDDNNYDLYNVFTPTEVNEIRTFKPKPLPVLPKDIKKILSQFNVTTSNEIRQKLGEISTFSNKFNYKSQHDNDWIVFTIYSLLRQYESGNFSKSHLEQWPESRLVNVRISF